MRIRALAASAGLLLAAPALALDPPHDASRSIACASCHTLHASPGGALTLVAGNANLCMSCHVAGGSASALPFVSADQALPAPGLPAVVAPSGTSHRWDSGPAGHVRAGLVTTSTGRVTSAGAYTGRYAKTYTLTITTSGNVGTARFSWTATTPGGGSGTNLLTAADVPLDSGVSVGFEDGASGVSFLASDTWYVHVRPDLVQPTSSAMVLRLERDKLMCSTCHDAHSQAKQPFDPAAPGYAGSGSGAGRHMQRLDNDADQICLECHAPRDVQAAAAGSHPVRLTVPGGAYQSPLLLPLDSANQVNCSTCHEVHYTPAADGVLLRLSDRRALCADCHTLANLGAPAAHFDASKTATLWPGGQYGSNFPAVTDLALRGSCASCHNTHGWPDGTSPTGDYPRLLVDREQGLCFTCHDADGPSARAVAAEFSKASNHPLALATDVHAPGEAVVVPGPQRHVECEDCHNSHQAEPRTSLPGPTTTPRPAVGPLKNVRGVDLQGNEVPVAAYEYEVCFRCHADSTGKPTAPTPRQYPESNVRLEFAGAKASFHPVALAGLNPNVPSMTAGWTQNSRTACTACHNNSAGPVPGGPGPNGPHGSSWPHLLERRFETASPQSYSAAKYALCFKCHSESSIRSNSSFGEHNKHVEISPCNVCHDPHASNKTHLINFDTRFVTPTSGGRLEFVDNGLFRGDCYLVCHGKNHNPLRY